MNEDAIRKQSEAAYSQWCEQWRKHAKMHSAFEQKDLIAFQNIGIGKAALCIANGYSFEENIDVIKKYQDNVDIMCVDKTLAHCLDNGIVPKFCLVCDANVNFSKYMEPVKDRLQDTILIMNVCANPEWSQNGNWKDKYFFVNEDVLGSNVEFAALSGCKNLIPAGTNVSNAQVVMLTQSNNSGKRNFFGYDKILLIGFDYSWCDESYYSFDRTGGGKANYMKMLTLFNLAGELCFTSSNLLFSGKWLEKYVQTFQLPVFQCSKRSILAPNGKTCDLAEQMQYSYKPEHSKAVVDLLDYRRSLAAKIKEINNQIFEIGRDHFKQVIRTT